MTMLDAFLSHFMLHDAKIFSKICQIELIGNEGDDYVFAKRARLRF